MRLYAFMSLRMRTRHAGTVLIFPPLSALPGDSQDRGNEVFVETEFLGFENGSETYLVTWGIVRPKLIASRYEQANFLEVLDVAGLNPISCLLEAFIRNESALDRERLIAMAEAMMRKQVQPSESSLKH